LNKDEAEKAPEGYHAVQAKGKGLEEYAFRIQVDSLDCVGCGSCVQVCPAKNKALEMKPLESQLPEMDNWYYSIGLTDKNVPIDKFTVKGSQFHQPLLEFSGACAGCGETPYMKLMTQLFGDRMYVANATGCTQAWGAACPCVPYTTDKNGRGPAFSNSLFENNAEFSLGMCLAVKQQRDHLAMEAKKVIEFTHNMALKETLEAWLEGFDEDEGTIERAQAVIAAAEKAGDDGKEFIKNKEHLTKKSMWMYGGDGWAYDIGYGGLDHVMAQGVDVNILIVDTEVYSNTGGQSSKATPVGAVAQFASSGKKTGKKDLGMLLSQYGNIYVAQVALGANPNQLIKALKEAESYKGPSIVIAYAPCINHGIVRGMAYAQPESKLAVDSGYWFLYRYDPRLKAEGKNPFQLDSKEPTVPLRDFLMGEVRYAALERTFPEEAKVLIKEAEDMAKEKYLKYKAMAEK
jgi:pyruvate-ferredoxin/flavodoxin oxidoreductase